MRIVVAPDSFKDALDAPSVARAIARGIEAGHSDCEIILIPMADGGEGMRDVMVDARGGQRRLVKATGPLGDPVEVVVGLIQHASTAVIELASVSGYSLISKERRDPLKTTTYGLGEVIRIAVESGVEEIILGLGGSATVDGGAGMMQALGMTFLDESGRPMRSHMSGGELHRIRQLVWDNPPDELRHTQFTIACDVLNPACGPNGAAAVFAPQKGADAAGVRLLEKGLMHWAQLLEKVSGRPLQQEPGTGAAGGVALPLLALTSATLVPGVDLVADSVHLANAIGDADLVITGEGCLDGQSMMGKVVGAVGRMAKTADVPCVAIVGKTGPGVEACLEFIKQSYTLECPLEETPSRLVEVGKRVVHELF
ncbi:MAG: glycerate kinase [Phycisphaerales bacterium]|nr:glycerate kinase [Phycisphaerales bacterium]